MEIYCIAVKFYLELKDVIVSFLYYQAGKVFLPDIFFEEGWELELYRAVTGGCCMREKAISTFLVRH
jgi:hypothetical protein